MSVNVPSMISEAGAAQTVGEDGAMGY
ncbi:hypothetical protein KIPB_014059, partial [Kipferlia bialata]|eukprot:g14059.t1